MCCFVNLINSHSFFMINQASNAVTRKNQPRECFNHKRPTAVDMKRKTKYLYFESDKIIFIL